LSSNAHPLATCAFRPWGHGVLGGRRPISGSARVPNSSLFKDPCRRSKNRGESKPISGGQSTETVWRAANWRVLRPYQVVCPKRGQGPLASTMFGSIPKATRRCGDLVSSNPFDDGDDDGNVLVAVIDEQHSRWPVLAGCRVGSWVVRGDADPGACRDYIQDHWPAIRAGSLRESLGGSIDT
jgi:uncharacterized protein YbdZ (MbtH family)